MHQIALAATSQNRHECADFISFMKEVMSTELCSKFEICTRSQSDSSEWHELRYGRITASILYETSRCKTTGSLTERILGASQPLQTEAIKRGKMLEAEVLKVVAATKKIKINKAGLFLNPAYPIFGASPDGITDNYVIEIKCPFKEKTVENYISVQLQMLFINKKKGLFCVASPSFEQNKQVTITEVELNREELEDVMDIAAEFWKSH
ncbi:hypothetical protein NQ315_014698, partial [Exocentrus adspersus]